MATVTYLAGGESPTAGRMNALWEVFEGKLERILAGKSFVLAWKGGLRCIPQIYMGQCFFFTGGATVRYAYRCPGAVELTGSELGIPAQCEALGWRSFTLADYDHTKFTTAAAAATALDWDDTLRIAKVSSPAQSAYPAGVTKAVVNEFSLWDYSLEAHKRTKPGTSIEYYLREDGVEHPERKYRYAVAEIILDGSVTGVTLPASYDKYNFFRIHNLTNAAKTVSFGSDYSVTVPALGCQTVRRDAATGAGANYRQGGKYFWRFEAGDYRHAWFYGSAWTLDALLGDHNTPGETQGPSSSMAANNLANPGLIYDWIRAFRFNPSPSMYAWWTENEHQVCDSYPLYAAKYGNPATLTTKLGDLLHHKGAMLLAKRHKTQMIPGTTYPRWAFETIAFNGYASLVSDLAAKNINVTTGPDGILRLQQGTDANWDYVLVPLGTNFLKQGTAFPSAALLTSARAIENAVLDDQAYPPSLSAQAPVLVVQRSVSETVNTKTFFNIATQAEVTVTGTPSRTLVETEASSGQRTSVAGIQNVTVSDLLSLKFWGRGDLADQGGDWAQYIDKSLVMTPAGLRLLFTERVPASIVPSWASDAWSGWDLVDGYFVRKRCIKFRGHGWGFGEGGREDSMFFPCRYGVPVVANGYQNEVKGADGADFEAHSLGVTWSDVAVQWQVPKAALSNGPRGGRFWQLRTRGGLLGFWKLRQQWESEILVDDITYWETYFSMAMLQADAFDAGPLLGGGQTAATPAAQPDNLSGISTAMVSAYPLLPEHYNALAMAVNSLEKGRVLNYMALRWIVTVDSVEWSMGFTDSTYGGWNQFPGPVAVNAFDVVSHGSISTWRQALYTALGISIRTESDLPSDYQTLKTVKCQDRLTNFAVTGSVSSAARNSSDEIWYGTIGLQVAMGAASSYVDAAEYYSGSYHALPAGYASLDPAANTWITLPTAYSGIQWVSIGDVRAALATAGLPFVFDEFFTPLKLALLECGSTPSTASSVSSVTMAGRPIMPDPNEWYVATDLQGSFSHTMTVREAFAKLIAFAQVTDASDATWKQSLPEASTHDVFHKRDWSARKPYYVAFQPGIITWVDNLGGGVFSLSTAIPQAYAQPGFAAVNSLPNGASAYNSGYLNGTTDGPFIQIEWSDSSAWSQHVFGYVKSLGYQAWGTGDIETKVQLVAQPFWVGQMDWWNAAWNVVFESDQSAQANSRRAYGFLGYAYAVTPNVDWGLGYASPNRVLEEAASVSPKNATLADDAVTVIAADPPSESSPHGSAFKAIIQREALVLL